MSKEKIIKILKFSFITTLLYILNIFILGSIVGIIYMIAYSNYSLNVYYKGIFTFFILNAIVQSWLYYYEKVKEQFGTKE